jgi:hypothetical protein
MAASCARTAGADDRMAAADDRMAGAYDRMAADDDISRRTCS